MILRFCKIVLSTLVAFLFILTTGGFSIYHSYCSHEKKESASIFIIGSCCSHHESNDEKECIHMGVTHQNCSEQCLNHQNCCSHTRIFLKIFSYYETDHHQHLDFNKSFWPINRLFFNEVLAETYIPYLSSRFISSIDITIQQGRQLLLFLHQLKICPSLPF